MVTPYDLNLRHLEGLAAVAEAGSISAAAELVNLSQPALTQAVRHLEEKLGRQLFLRRTGGVEPTEAGLLLAGRVRRALAFLGAAARAVRRSARLDPVARHITMAQLRGVIALDRTGSYVGAAAMLGIAQPSVHRAVRELELMLGTALMTREGRAVRPTTAATRFIRLARLAIAELQAGLDELSALDAEGAGRIVVGTLPLAGAALLPTTLATFLAGRPQVRVRVVEGPYSELLAALRHGEIDCLIGALRDPALAADVVQQPLFDDILYVVGRAGHPAGMGASIPDLAAYPWVMAPSGTPLQGRWRTMFEAAGVAPPDVAVECGSVIATRGLLLGGDWLTVLSLDQFRIEEAAGLIVRIGGAVPNSERSIGLTTRTDWQPTGLQRAFVEALKRQVFRSRHPETR